MADSAFTRRLARATAVLLFAWIAIASFPREPQEFGPGYDRSFLLGLSAAHAQGLAFGEQFIYPYGPLAYLCHPLSASGAMGTGVVLQCAAYGLFLALLVLLVRRVQGPWTAVWCLAVIGAACVIDPLGFWLSHLDAALGIAALLAFATPPARRLPPLLLVAALAGAMALIKMDAATPAVVLCAALALLTAWQRRDDRPAVARLLLLPPLTFVATLVALYFLESGSVAAVPAYLVNSARMMAGYKEMSVDGPPENLALVLSALGAVFLLLPLLVRDRRALLAGFALILVPVFLLWMRVAMRQDAGHQVSCLPRLALLLLFPLLMLPSARDRLVVGALQLLVLGAGTGFVVLALPDETTQLLSRISGGQLQRTASALSHWEQTSRELAEISVSNGFRLRLGDEAAAIVGGATVDAVPYQLEAVMANGWRWQGRPVPQDGNAYSPPLDRLNAAHFGSDAAARFVLADVYTIDGRHPFLEAPLGWRALLDRYDLRARFPETLLLERRAAPRFDPPALLRIDQVGWDQELKLPKSDELLLLSCRIEPGLAGRAAGLVYRNAPVSLDVRYRSGAEMRWRAVRPNLASGVLISQLPVNHWHLSEIFESGPGRTDKVVSLRLHTDEPWQFAPSLTVKWWTLPCRADQRPWHAEPGEHAPVAAVVPAPAPPPPPAPVLHMTGEPRLGQAIDVVLEGAAPLGDVRLMIGAGPATQHDASSRFALDPQRMLVFATAADAAGIVRVSLLVPSDTRLAGLDATLQADVANAAGARPRRVLSDALHFVIGN